MTSMYTKMMTHLCLNKLLLPPEVIHIVDEYSKVNKIPRDDARYELLRTIPSKQYDPEDRVTYVYMAINEEKDYFLTYTYEEGTPSMQLQTLFYGDDNDIYQVDGHVMYF